MPTTWSELRWHAMGSIAHLQVLGGPPRTVDGAVAELEGMEACWSRFRPASELCRLNGDPSTRVVVSPLLAEALRRAVAGWELTGGRYDPTVLVALERAGYRLSHLPGRGARGHLVAHPAVGMSQVTITDQIVERPPGLRLDLGGVGKGLAADLLAQWCLDRGCESVSVSLGGDVRVAGRPPTDGWRVAVADPRQGVPWLDVRLGEGAIVTSTTIAPSWPTLDGGRAHHLVDPSTGLPSDTGVLAAVVVAAEAWWAEVLAKAAVVTGPEAGTALLDRHGAGGWLVTPGGVHDAGVSKPTPVAVP